MTPKTLLVLKLKTRQHIRKQNNYILFCFYLYLIWRISLLNCYLNVPTINIITSKNLRRNIIKQLLLLVLLKILHNNVIPTFAKVKGTFLTEEHQCRCEKDIMKSHLKIHRNNLVRLLFPQLFCDWFLLNLSLQVMF